MKPDDKDQLIDEVFKSHNFWLRTGERAPDADTAREILHDLIDKVELISKYGSVKGAELAKTLLADMRQSHNEIFDPKWDIGVCRECRMSADAYYCYKALIDPVVNRYPTEYLQFKGVNIVFDSDLESDFKFAAADPQDSDSQDHEDF